MIERESAGEVVVLRLAHGKVNALDLELLTAVTAELTELRESADEAPPLVLTGRGTSFSAGVDLRRIVTEPVEYVERYLHALSTAFTTLYGYPGPTVAAVNGHAIAGGYVLAAACDHRVAAAGGGRLGLTELRVGVPFPTAAIEIVRQALGERIAAALATDAELRDVPAAAAEGLVHQVVEPEQLVAVAVEQAATRARRGADAYRFTKRQLQRPAWERIERHGPGEDAQVRAMWSHEDGLRRIRVYLESLSTG
ncbi:MAG TPA: enoyl-CoA hydratase/isomerase family protein [Pseudonocardiaceae bacterium]